MCNNVTKLLNLLTCLSIKLAASSEQAKASEIQEACSAINARSDSARA